MSIRKASFFFPFYSEHSAKSGIQLIRSFAVGTEVRSKKGLKQISEIQEKMDLSGERNFDIYVNSPGESVTMQTLWKNYYPKVSDIEIEYDI